MSLPLSAHLTRPPDEAAASEVLYESPTTKVFRPRDAPSGAGLVFKEFLGSDAERRLKHERDMLALLGHVDGVAHLVQGTHRPGVLALRDSGGQALSHVLASGRCDIEAAVSLAAHLARTLAGVHRAGVIHRDINPANIVVTPDGRPELIDFDLAVPAEARPVEAQGAIVGTLAYLAPEQTGRTGRAVDQRADLYALGTTLYQMTCGRLPFDARDTLQLIHDHMVREPDAPAQANPLVPRGLSDIVMRLLAKEPALRYQSAEGLLHDLQKLRGRLGVGEAGSFELGERDFPLRLAAPAQLVGRDAEVEVLRGAFEDARGSQGRTVLVEGAPGVGKSALVKELRPWVQAAGGWFVQGKFDQYQKDAAATGGLTQAGRALGRLLLSLPPEELAAERARILDRVGRNVGLLARLSPEFALLLGTQPEVLEIDPQQAEVRLQQALVDLLAAVASPMRPLVIVLDDLQWAPAQSLRTFERVMAEPAPSGLLLVGSFRPGDPGAGDEFVPALARWRQQARPPVNIALGALPAEGMGELVGRMLRLDHGPAQALAQAVGALTAGNPFDTVEMVNAMRAEGVLALGDGGWQWQDAAIHKFVGRSNVVDLLAVRIGRLPRASRELMDAMACLGNPVARELLCAASGLDDESLQERLRAPLDDGLIVADASSGPDSLHFRHDRVQQAVLAAMDDARRSSLQLEMGRRLASLPAFETDAAQQYLACAGSLDEPGEQRRVAGLFCDVARTLAGTATYQLAESYLSAASALLDRIADRADAGLRASIDVGRHEALYSLGRLAESDRAFDAICARNPDPLDLVGPAGLQLRSLSMRDRLPDALQLGLRVLRQLGVDVPADCVAPDAEQRLDALSAWVHEDSRLDPVRRALMREPRLLAIAKLMSRIGRAAYFCSRDKASVWLLLESQRMWAQHGPCPALLVCLCISSNLFVARRQDYRSGYEIVRHVLAVGEALGWEPQTSEARSVFAGTACHWFEPLENSFRHASRAYEIVKSRGDVSHACVVHRTMVVAMSPTSPTLGHYAAEVEAGMVLYLRAGNRHLASMNTGDRQYLGAMRGHTDVMDPPGDSPSDERKFAAHWGELPYIELSYRSRHAAYAAYMGDVPALAMHATRAYALVDALPSYYIAVNVRLYLALARAWQIQADRQAATPAIRAELDECLAWLAARAHDQPHNFLHILRLVEAEQAWAEQDLWRAAACFDSAVDEAQTRQRAGNRAMITERAGLFQLSMGLVRGGRELLARSRDHYEAWGAVAKVKRMEREHPFLAASGYAHETRVALTTNRSVRGSGAVSAESLDLVGVLRASQALSSETSLERLTTRVTEVLAALSGATQVLVLACTDGQWALLTPKRGQAPMPVAVAAQRSLFPLSVFTYAERTGEVLVVDDATTDDRFAADPYFADVPMCSLMVASIAGQGMTRTMLLLENRMGRAAFNAQRLDAVMLVAGQLAVSLANVQLYESLEQRVQARTRELQQTQAQLVSTARRAGMAEIANNVLHNVGNVLNSINVSAEIVRKTVSESRAEGLRRAVALMNERDQEQDLGRFMDTDPRGRALLGYMNGLVEALEAERREALADLEWDPLESTCRHASLSIL